MDLALDGYSTQAQTLERLLIETQLRLIFRLELQDFKLFQNGRSTDIKP
jgi:hypothetical protein